MELVSAHWDPNGRRWVGGAQDNSVMFTTPNASATDEAIGFIDGDGTSTAVDSTVSPSRLWGAVENMGNWPSDDPGPGLLSKQQPDLSLHPSDHHRGDDDSNCTGFGFFWHTDFVCVPLLKWFGGEQFPQFDNPWTLHAADPTQVFMFAGAAADGGGKSVTHGVSGIYRMHVAHTIETPDHADHIPAPTLEVATDDVYVIIAGGQTAGKADPSVLVAMNDTSLLHRSATSGGKVVVRPLPTHFARPVVTAWLPHAPPHGQYTLGPMSHARTVSLSVSPSDSALVAVSGWCSVMTNDCQEDVWVSADAGRHYTNVTGDLRRATRTIGQWRPSALLLVPLTSNIYTEPNPGTGTTAHSTAHNTTAHNTAAHSTAAHSTTAHSTAVTTLLVGTVHGVFVSFVTTSEGAVLSFSAWARLGSCDMMPLTLVAGLSYEPTDDTIVAATMGRGVYVVHNATHDLQTMYAQAVVA